MSFKQISIIILIGVIGALVYFFFIPYIQQSKGNALSTRIQVEIASNNEQPLNVQFNNNSQLTVTLADTEAERDLGLGNRDSLPEDQGLLFVFEQSGLYPFWMKDMHFPIDIAWMDSNFKLVHIESNISPSTYPSSFVSDGPAKYVIETNANYFKDKGIVEGDVLSLSQSQTGSI